MFNIAGGFLPLLILVAPVLLFRILSGHKPDPLSEMRARAAASPSRPTAEDRPGEFPVWSGYVMVLLGIWMFLLLPPWLIHGIPDGASARGMLQVAAEKLGGALAACIIGLLGLLFRPAPFAAYCILSGAMLYAMITGAISP